MKFYLRILSWLLFQANTNPGAWHKNGKEIFYRIKEKILKKHGTLLGYEYQHFPERECYRCEGTGQHYHFPQYEEDGISGYYEECWSCGGSGIYKTEKWIGLKKIQFGKYQFHLPTGKIEGHLDSIPATLNIIEGIIKHEKKEHSQFANFILLLIFKGKLPYRVNSIYPLRKIKNYLSNKWFVLTNDDLPF